MRKRSKFQKLSAYSLIGKCEKHIDRCSDQDEQEFVLKLALARNRLGKSIALQRGRWYGLIVVATNIGVIDQDTESYILSNWDDLWALEASI